MGLSFLDDAIGQLERRHLPDYPVLPPLMSTPESRVDSNTFTVGNPMPGSTLSPSQELRRIWPLKAESASIISVSSLCADGRGSAYISYRGGGG